MRKAKREARAAADLAPDLDVAAEKARVLERDGEAKPASRAGSGGVCLVEAVEDVQAAVGGMPAPRSLTSRNGPTPSRPTLAVTSRPPCSSALPMRFDAIRSRRRWSDWRTTSSPSTRTRSSQARERTAERTSEPGRPLVSYPRLAASSREISIRSSTRSLSLATS
jgi:hypothetical protein